MALLTNFLRTDPKKAKHITSRACLLGYAVTLVAVPFAAAAIALLLRLAQGALAETALIPALTTVEAYFQLLAHSYLISWLGALLSIPLVLLARAAGAFGWGTAILSGIVIMELVAWGIVGEPPLAAMRYLGLPAATLGLLFWITVRMTNPHAFG